jgi:transitional endoplasmic reticulum ATPase
VGNLEVVLFLSPPAMNPHDPLLPLREALKFSPDNIPLRQHIADTLLNRGEAAAAAIEY